MIKIVYVFVIFVFAPLLCAAQGMHDVALQLDSTTIEFNESLKSDTIIGDFNGDGKKEKAWMKSPYVLNWDEQKCDGPIVTYICFSDSSLESIKIDGCVGGKIQMLGDLNYDGCDELGYFEGWFSSNVHEYHVYGHHKAKKWKNLIKPYLLHSVIWDDDIKGPAFLPVKKVDKHRVVEYTYDVLTDNVTAKVVRIK